MKYFYFHFLTLNLKLKLKVEGGGSPSWRLIQSLMGNCLYGLWLALKTFIPEALTGYTVPFGKVKSDLLLIVPASSLNGFKKVSGPWFDCFSSVKSRNEMWLLVTMCKLVCGIVYKKPLDCISNAPDIPKLNCKLAKLSLAFQMTLSCSRTVCMHVKDILNSKRTVVLAWEVNKLEKEAAFHSITQEIVPV